MSGLIKKFLEKNFNGDKLTSENEKDNIEYKLRLDHKNSEHLNKMISQLKWRINQGFHKYGYHYALYIIGVNDNGTFGNLNISELLENQKIFENRVIRHTSYEILKQDIITNNIKQKCLIMEIGFETLNIPPDRNIMIVGQKNSGKTTLLGRLVEGLVDDGYGFVRDLMLKHEHEKEDGKTTTVKMCSVGLSDKKIYNNDSNEDNNYKTFDDNLTNLDYTLNIYDSPSYIQYFDRVISLIHSIPFSLIIFLYHYPNSELPKHIKYLKKLSSYFKIPYISVFNTFDCKFHKTNMLKINLCSNKKLKDLENIIIDKCYNPISHIESYQKNIPTPIYVGVDSYTIPHMGGCIVLGRSLNGIKENNLYQLFFKQKTFPIVVKSIHSYGREIDEADSNCSLSINIINPESSRPIYLENNKIISLFNCDKTLNYKNYLPFKIIYKNQYKKINKGIHKGLIINSYGIDFVNFKKTKKINAIVSDKDIIDFSGYSTLKIDDDYFLIFVN
jgi:GTPase SAR1 family protein